MPVPASTRRSLCFRRKTKVNEYAPWRNCLRRDGSLPERETGRCDPIGRPIRNGFPKESIPYRPTKRFPEVPPARRCSRRSIAESMSTPEHPGVDVDTSPGYIVVRPSPTSKDARCSPAEAFEYLVSLSSGPRPTASRSGNLSDPIGLSLVSKTGPDYTRGEVRFRFRSKRSNQVVKDP